MNTHLGGISVIEIVLHTHIIVLEKYRHASLIYLWHGNTHYKRPHKSPGLKEDQALAAIHSQNNNSGKPPEILLSFYLKNIYLHMFQYTREDILVYNAHYLHQLYTTEAHFDILIRYLQINYIVDYYIHFINTDEYPLQRSYDESDEDYLLDSYDF